MTDQMSVWESAIFMALWVMHDFPLFWPLLLLAGLGVTWHLRRRPGGRRRWVRSLLVLGLLGSVPWLFFGVPALVHQVQSETESRYWRRVDEAAKPMRLAELDRVLAERGPQGYQDYLERLVEWPMSTVDAAVSAHLFRHCADLMLASGGGTAGDSLLVRAVFNGQSTLLRQALAEPPCPGARHPDREREVAGRFLAMVQEAAEMYGRDTLHAYRPPHDTSHQLRVDALLVLLDRYPRLLDVERPEGECPSIPQQGWRCNALSIAFLEGHRSLALALLPRDRQADRHLPGIALHLLNGRVESAAQLARRRPQELLQLLPALFATAKPEALAGLSRAVPLDGKTVLEAAQLSVHRDREAGFHLIEAPFLRQPEAGDRPALWPLLDLVGTRLGATEVRMLAGQLHGQPVEEPLSQRLLVRLKQAGLSCEVIGGMVWAPNAARDAAVFKQLTGCEFPAAEEEPAR